MTTTTHHLTTADIDAALADERHLGWGYATDRLVRGYSERTRANRADVKRADRIVLRYANRLGWDAEDLFHWTNSKLARWFGDWAFGCDSQSGPVEPTWLADLFPAHPER